MFASLKSGFKVFSDELKNGDSVAKTLASHVKGILSPFCLLIGAGAALFSLSKAMWDKLVMSEEAYTEKLAAAAGKAGRHREEIARQIEQEKGYAAQLEELSSAELSGNISKEQT